MARGLKVSFVITDLHRGGSPLVLFSIATGLKRRGFAVEVIVLADKGEVGEMLERQGVPVVALEAAGTSEWRVFGRLVRRLRETRPRIVCSILVHANGLAAVARRNLERSERRAVAGAQGKELSRIKWVQSIHTVQEKPRWHWFVQGMILRRADVFVAPSQAVVDKVLRSGKLAAGAWTAVIPNGFDVRRFIDAAPIEENRRPWLAGGRAADGRKPFVVGYVGRFDRVKRLELLIEAAAILLRRDPDRFGNLHVVLVGYGREEARLRDLAERRGLLAEEAGGRKARVHFVGASDQPERWYKVFDAFCSPSAAEGFGMTLAEATVAAAAGHQEPGSAGQTPGTAMGAVIACATPAVRETLDEAIWLPQHPVAQDVANAIETAQRAGGAAGPSVQGVQRVAERYGEQKMVERYAALFLKLAENSAAPVAGSAGPDGPPDNAA